MAGKAGPGTGTDGEVAPGEDPSLRAGPARPSQPTTTQRRSADRRDEFLDAASALLDEVGIERFSTTLLAERAGTSIGSVYRYFTDKLDVLRALAERNMRRYIERLQQGIGESPGDYLVSVHMAIEIYTSMMRDEIGFRQLRFGDVLDAWLWPDTTSTDRLVDATAEIAVNQFRFPDSADLVLHLSVATELASSLVSRAFRQDPAGDPRYLETCHSMIDSYLIQHLGSPPA